jgi:hypothetical protein
MIKKMSDYNPTKDIKSGKDLLVEFKEFLPSRIEAASISTIAKIPFKTFILREALLHRVTELGETAIELYEKKNRLVSAFIITRCVHETVALFYWFYDRLSDVVEKGELSDFDDFIMKVLFGWKINDDEFPTAYNILTAVNKLNKKIDTFRGHYDRLSEFCYPNYSGVHGAYGRTNHETISVELGHEVSKVSPVIGLPPLVASLNIFKHFYNESAELLPRFIEICEEDIEKKS